MKTDLKEKQVTIKVPATIANIVCGFDMLGLAINEPFDELTIRISENPGIRIQHTDQFGLPEDPAKNVAGVALKAMMAEITDPPGFSMTIHKNILPGSGLGSSAASSMGAVAAANILLGNPFNREQLLRFAMQGEKAASGTAHADNVAPCLYGGITLISSDPVLAIKSLPYPELYVTVLHPQIEVKTSDSRQIIRKEVALSKAVKQWSYVGGLVAGICTKDFELIKRSLKDVIFEPSRSLLIPGFADLRNAAMNEGALGGGISGSGPAVFMLSSSKPVAEKVENTMTGVYKNYGVEFKTYVTTIKSTPLL